MSRYDSIFRAVQRLRQHPDVLVQADCGKGRIVEELQQMAAARGIEQVDPSILELYQRADGLRLSWILSAPALAALPGELRVALLDFEPLVELYAFEEMVGPSLIDTRGLDFDAEDREDIEACFHPVAFSREDCSLGLLVEEGVLTDEIHYFDAEQSAFWGLGLPLERFVQAASQSFGVFGWQGCWGGARETYREQPFHEVVLALGLGDEWSAFELPDR